MADTVPSLRVCIVAKATPFIWVHHYVKAFRALCDVITVGSALTSKDLAATGRSHLAHLVETNDVDRDVGAVEELVAALPAGWRPDLIVTIQSGVPQIENIDWLTCPTAHISVDTWHDFAEMLHARPYDFVFAAQREFAAHFAAAGCANAQWLPLACDPEAHCPIPCRRDYDIAFVGSIERTLHAERTGRLTRLAERFSVHIDTALDSESMSRTYSRARIAFNSSVAQDVNMRVFETMAMGIPLLTNRDAEVNGLLELFRDGEHLITYDDANLLELAEQYLSNDTARDRIGVKARKEVLARHTYARRVAALLETISRNVDWDAVRARPLLRGHGSLVNYLPAVPGRVADLGMNAGVSKYALRTLGVLHVTGTARDVAEAERRRGSYDEVRVHGQGEECDVRYDTVLAVTAKGEGITRDVLHQARDLLRCGGTLVAGLSQRDMKELCASEEPGGVWSAIETLGFVVLRMELREARDADDVYAFVVARNRERSLKDVAQEVYSRNPIPGMSLEETLARVP